VVGGAFNSAGDCLYVGGRAMFVVDLADRRPPVRDGRA